MNAGPWVVVVAAIGGLSLLLLATRLLTWRPGPGPGPPALDPGPEPPAVASLLAAGGRLRPRAAAATILDLGARGCLDLEWRGPAELVCRAVRRPPAPLPAFERRVLDRAAALATGPAVPVGALLPDPREDEGGRWHHEFEREVGEAAERMGLVRPRLPAAVRWLLTAAAVPLPAAVLAASFRDNAISAALFGALLGPGLAGLVYAALPRGWVVTPAGRAAARRWLGLRAALLADGRRRLPETPVPLGDSLRARAVAVGADPALSAAFASPASGRAWSGYGGRWRQVRIVGPPRSRLWLAAGGLALVIAVGAGGFFLVMSTWLSAGSGVGPQAVLLAPVPLGLVMLVIGGLWLALRQAGREPAGRRTFEGQVVRRRAWVDDEGGGDVYELVIDDGTDRARTWSVHASQYDQCPPGTIVRATTDGFGNLVAVIPLVEAPPTPAGDPRLPPS